MLVHRVYAVWELLWLEYVLPLLDLIPFLGAGLAAELVAREL